MQQVADVFQSPVMNELAPPLEYIIPEDRRERYFFYAGDEPGRPYPGGMSVQTPCIPNRTIRRCQVTPCISVQRPARLNEIPEGRIIQGTQHFIDAKIGRERTGFAKFWLFSGPEAITLLSEYGNEGDSTKQWGLVELAAEYLTGKDWREVARLDLTGTFFPNWPNLPETNTELMSQLLERIEELKVNPEFSRLQWTTPDSKIVTYGEVYRRCSLDMIRAIEQAQAYQEMMISNANLAVTLPSTETGYKSKFDDRDKLFSKRAGIPLAINSLRQNANAGVESLVTSLVEKLQPQIQPAAPGVDPATIAAIAAATVTALKDAGIIAAPAPAPVPVETPEPEKPKKPKAQPAKSE